MAGNAKPNIVGLKKEATYTVLNIQSISGSGGTSSNCGLFDGTTPNEWDTAHVMYWKGTTDYIEIIINQKCNIWRCGTTTWANDDNSLTIMKWNGSSYDDVTSQYSQTLTTINNMQWEKTISDLPAGQYKFERGTGYRIDSEWYLERLNNFLIKQNNQYYSIKPEFYSNGNYSPLT